MLGQGLSDPVQFKYGGQNAFSIGSQGDFGVPFLYRATAPLTPTGLRFTNEATGVTVQLQPDGTFTTTGHGEYYGVAVPQG